ncbi:unnamed protein product [Bursaphelenchus okinawaensis]|uniref:MFS domain-containing protein n=1 Tax=Bursaphelenchus okinawaensis TaxID=465554 RepID=A0A811LRU6_9BILA|nr:unnamed protein product [Bursaphelenchus okinawaensis]CAG9127242.1 unnamed protein product [Bursaphelenchus okinawaensis]
MGVLNKIKDSTAIFTTPKEPTFIQCSKTPWKSIYVTGAISFLVVTQFAMFFSSMWPYLQTLDPEITEPFYGFIVGAYSVGSMGTATLFSKWSAKTRTVKEPIMACMAFMAVGNIIYLFVPLAPVPLRKWTMLFGRFILGFGDNSLALLQGYTSTASTPKDRSRAIAIMTGGLSVGFALAPALQICFSPLGNGFQLLGNLRLNMYSAPSLAAIVACVVAFMLMKLVFVDEYAGISSKHEEKAGNLPPPDKLAIVLCCLGRYIQFFTFVNLEAIGAAYVETYFAQTKKFVVLFISGSHISCGVLSMFVYSCYIFFKLGKKVNARFMLIISFVGFFLFYLITFQWPFLDDNIQTYTENDLHSYLDGWVSEEPLGCNVDRYDWCTTMTLSNKWLYFAAFALFIGFGWPNINVCLGTVYSNIIGPRHQAYYQGILQMCASGARLTGPIFMSSLYRAWGPRYVWGVELVALSLQAALLCIFYKRLVPLETEPERKQTDVSQLEVPTE